MAGIVRLGTRTDATKAGWTLRGVSPDPRGGLLADFPVRVGDEVHVVYATYSVGDSLGLEDVPRIEFFGVHRDESMAMRNADLLEATRGCGDDRRAPSVVLLATDGGVSVPVRVPWAGCFETLGTVAVAALRVGADAKEAA